MKHVTEIHIPPETIVPFSFSHACGESPFWSSREQCFYWADIPAKRIHRWNPFSNAHRQWALDEQVGCVVERRSGGLLASCESGIFSIDPDGTSTKVDLLHGITHPASNMRFNDGKCDRHGRLWISSFMMSSDKQPVGSVFRCTPDELSAPQLTGFMTPNGMAFSPDNRTLYVSDSHTDVRKVWKVEFDLESGSLGERKLFVDMAAFAGRPDGAAVDTDGCYWVAGMGDGCIMRFTPTGVLDRIVRVPMRNPTMCAFGGADMRQMLVTSLTRGTGASPDDPYAGRIAFFDVDAQGIAEVPFAD